MPPAAASAEMPDPSAIVTGTMKREILRHEKDWRFLRTCLERSRTLKDANECEKLFSHRIGEPSNPPDHWDEATKQKTLKEIDEALKAMECVKKAKDMAEIEACSP
jgi:hypothetical protein